MHLVQILLPLRDNTGASYPRALFDDLRADLTARFGGVTAFLRAPAQGAWMDDADRVAHDDVVILEVMDDALDRAWWSAWRARMEAALRQTEIVVRASRIERL